MCHRGFNQEMDAFISKTGFKTVCESETVAVLDQF